MSDDVIIAKNLVKRYGSVSALDSASFQVKRGEISGLIGPNGAGKTTALKAILGLTSFEGELSVLGRDPFRQRADLMRDVSFVADVAVLPDWIKTKQLIDYCEAIHPNFSRARAEAQLARTEIRADARVKTLSKGMVAQLHLALVMAIDAQLLVLDEPTLGLDILFRKSFYDTLLNDYYSADRSILITTHQVEEVESILTDLKFIRHGQIVLDSSMDQIRHRFIEAMVNADQLAKARALGPISEREVMGRKIMLFRDIPREQLEPLGELHTPGVADLFVATMQEGQT